MKEEKPTEIIYNKYCRIPTMIRDLCVCVYTNKIWEPSLFLCVVHTIKKIETHLFFAPASFIYCFALSRFVCCSGIVRVFVSAVVGVLFFTETKCKNRNLNRDVDIFERIITKQIIIYK